MSGDGETIVAVASGVGASAVSLVRLSGSGVTGVVDACCSADLLVIANNEPRVQKLATIRTADGLVIDEVLVTVFPGPRSYTGEDVVELGCHGGRLVTDRVVGRLVECGARVARPGEFTERAFLNGKMDLTQAEAVMDLIEAQTDLALRAAHGQLSGKLGEVLLGVRKELLGVLAHLEATIDFPEEGLAPDTASDLARRSASSGTVLRDLAKTAEMGRFLREGVRTVICGEPNVGKSSLLNHLLGFERAIVSEHAGTTRDTIEEVINIGGIPVRLTDTAGLRVSEDEVERAGIARTERMLSEADFVIEVIDASKAPGQRVEELRAGVRKLVILNKCDLGVDRGWEGVDGVRISCLRGEGLEGLTGELEAKLIDADVVSGQDSLMAVSARHRGCLDAAGEAIDVAVGGFESGVEPEFIAIDLRRAMDAIGEIVGKVDSEELLGEIFGSFCVGK